MISPIGYPGLLLSQVMFTLEMHCVDLCTALSGRTLRSLLREHYYVSAISRNELYVDY